MKNHNLKSKIEKEHLENINLVISLYKANMSISEIAEIVKIPNSIIIGIIEKYQKLKFDQILINKHDTNNNQGRIK